MLPTLAFILGAYGMYALITAWSRRQGGKFKGRHRSRRYGWLTLAGSTALGLGLILWLCLPPDHQEQNLRFAGFLGGLGWEDGGTAAKTERPLESLPIKGQGSGDKPVYAYLHPETPPQQIGAEKKPPPARPLRKPKLQKLPKPQAKGGKVSTSSPKKEKAAGKTAQKSQKKKKPSSSPETPKSTGG
ncbi:MAG: hypothetical protein Q8M54_02130 [Desulfobaccales bacterium]|nr:hypothetical protein [Desulfobaccales bacterium]